MTTAAPRPLLVDFYSCAGGASRGYHDAGFDVVGVDHEPQPNYPYEFVRADALEYLRQLRADRWRYRGRPIAVLAGSPPCQRWSASQRLRGRDHPDLVAPTRELFAASGLPYVIENVPGAPLVSPLVLCGTEFGLGAAGRRLSRHRLFESNVPLFGAGGCSCRRGETPINPFGHSSPGGGRGFPGYTAAAREAMGVDWTTRDELAQAIPPAYTKFIGEQLLAYLGWCNRTTAKGATA